MPGILGILLGSIASMLANTGVKRGLQYAGERALRNIAPEIGKKALPGVLGTVGSKVGLGTLGEIGDKAAGTAGLLASFPAFSAGHQLIAGHENDAESATRLAESQPSHPAQMAAMQKIAMQQAIEKFVRADQEDEQLINDLLRGMSNGKPPMTRLI